MLIKMKYAAVAAKSLQSCPTLCDPTDGSPPGSPIPGILQARTLEWVALSFSNAWKWKVKLKSLSRVWFFVTPWTAAYQAPPSMGFSRQEWGAIAFSVRHYQIAFSKENASFCVPIDINDNFCCSASSSAFAVTSVESDSLQPHEL